MNSLPDGLADALGRVVADARKEFRKEFEGVTADALAFKAELKAESRILSAEMRADVLAFKAELKTAADLELARVPEVLAGVKDGAPGKDGANGIDGVNGKDIGPRDVQGMLAAEVAKAFSEFPQPKDGVPGKAGSEGIPGRDGRDGLPGVQGEKGLDGKDGRDGLDGKDGLDGADSKGLAGVEDCAPDDVAKIISRGVSLLAETPPLVVSPAVESQPSITLNVNGPERRKSKKTITTRRDADGNLVANVVEEEAT